MSAILPVKFILIKVIKTTIDETTAADATGQAPGKTMDIAVYGYQVLMTAIVFVNLARLC